MRSCSFDCSRKRCRVSRISTLLRAGDGRVGIDQVDRIEQASAVVALVAARLFVAAVRARALDIAVRQEALVVDGVDLARGALLDQAIVFENVGEMLRQLAVGLARGTAEPVERQREAGADASLDLVLFVAVLRGRLAGFGGGEFGGRAVLVGRTDKEHLVAHQPAEARIDVSRQHRPGEIAEVLDAVDVRQGRGDEDTRHLKSLVESTGCQVGRASVCWVCRGL